MNINESSENYLETILRLREKSGSVRAVDIAQEMGFSKPSVSVAMKRLRENGYIRVAADGDITLCESGLAIAVGIYERHRVLAHMLIGLGVSEKTAYADACKIEHDLSDESFARIREHFGSDATNR